MKIRGIRGRNFRESEDLCSNIYCMIRIVKYLFSLTLSILGFITCPGQVETTQPTRSHLSVPKRIDKWVNDTENIFSASEARVLDSMIKSFERFTSIEIAVVTFDSTYTTAENFDNFVLSIHNDWGVGKKELNNGIVIGVSRALRKVRINNGYGIEKKISDEETKEIIDQVILPEFKKSNYFEGVKKGIQTLISKLE